MKSISVKIILSIVLTVLLSVFSFVYGTDMHESHNETNISADKISDTIQYERRRAPINLPVGASGRTLKAAPSPQEQYTRKRAPQNNQQNDQQSAYHNTTQTANNSRTSGSIKIYNNRGQLLSKNSSLSGQSVIVLPRVGKAISGKVTGNTGNSIVIESSDNAEQTFKYGEIDSIVGL